MKLRGIAPLCLSITLSALPVDGATFEDLLAKAPVAANAVVMIDVDNTLNTSLARKEGWGKELEAAYVERPIFLPPEASKLVLAASLDASQNFRRNWELAVMALSEPMSMRSIARSEGGYVDELRGAKVAWTPSDAYFISLTDRILGALYPANRQFVGRWIDYATSKTDVTLSEYLSNAVEMTNDKIQILLAIDLTDVVRPHELDDRVRQSDLFRKANLSSDEAIPLITSLRGAMLRLSIGDDARAELRIDFDQDVTPLKSIAKELVLEVLTEIVGDLEDFQSWKVKVDGTAIRMAGMLSQDGQRRVFSVIELPSAKFSMVGDDENDTGDEPDESLIRETSLTYFKSIDVLLKDLKRDLRGNKASAAIMERYAGRIDRMPILHVDDDLLDYGADVAETLRMISLAKRQGGIQSGVATAGMGGGGYSNYSYSYGWGSTGDKYQASRASAADRTAMKAQAMAESKNVRVEGAKLIADATAAIRRAMTKKYQVEF